MNLFFFMFTSRPTSLLISNRASVFLCYLCFHLINYIISIDQKLMCPIQFPSHTGPLLHCIFFFFFIITLSNIVGLPTVAPRSSKLHKYFYEFTCMCVQ
jgi:hypothetical protein